MSSTNFTNNVTLTDAAWFDDADTLVYGHLTGVAGTDTITATGPVSLTAYAAGKRFWFIPAATNTGPTTIAITGASALAARNIFCAGAACGGGEIRQNVPVCIHDDGTQFNIVGPYSGGAVPGNIAGAGSIKSSHATAGIGYTTGAGGTNTQSTSKATTVILNKATGELTLHNALLSADTSVSFTLTNSAVAAGDLVYVQHVSAGTAGAYGITALAAGGAATVTVRNLHTASLSEAIVLKFMVLKAVTA
jgi:hypothetical protein